MPRKNPPTAICSIEGCDNVIRANNVCVKHYSAQRRKYETIDPNEFWEWIKKELDLK